MTLKFSTCRYFEDYMRALLDDPEPRICPALTPHLLWSPQSVARHWSRCTRISLRLSKDSETGWIWSALEMVVFVDERRATCSSREWPLLYNNLAFLQPKLPRFSVAQLVGVHSSPFSFSEHTHQWFQKHLEFNVHSRNHNMEMRGGDSWGLTRQGVAELFRGASRLE